jgi:hypothetical protein
VPETRDAPTPFRTHGKARIHRGAMHMGESSMARISRVEMSSIHSSEEARGSNA